MHNLFRTIFLFLVLPGFGLAAPIDVIYVGPDGTFDEAPTNYTVANNWSPPGVPNNVIGSSYFVTIPKAVFVDIPIVVTGLTITTAGSLTVKGTSSATGSFDIDGDTTADGSLVAYDSNVTVHGALTNFDASTGTLNSGSLTVEAIDQSINQGATANLQFTDANIVHNAGLISLTGQASITDQLARDGLRNFADNMTNATFVVGSGYTFTSVGNFTNAGTVDIQPSLAPISGGDLASASFVVSAGHQYTQTAGLTTVDGSLNADLIDIQGGELTTSGQITGTVTAEAATISSADQGFNASLTGNLGLGGDSTLLFHIPSLDARVGDTYLTTNFDHLTVAGTVTLGQSTLALDVGPGYPISSHATFTVLDSSATFVGNFGNVTNGARLSTLDGKGSFIVTDNAQQVVLSEFQTIPAAAQFGNISTRGDVLIGDNILIGGFIIGGTTAKNVIVRAIGPSLAGQGIATPLADPTLELHDSTGALLLANDNWKDTQRNLIEATGLAPTDDLESAIVATLDPGAYTAIVRGKNAGTGTALVEIYDLATDVESTLSNISTRGFVTPTNPLIGGFIAGGSGTGESEIVARAIGPDLAAAGIPNALPNPVLTLYDSDGNIVASDDDYATSVDDIVTINNLTPGNAFDAVLHVTLAPAAYTAIVTPKANGSGVALVEFYDLYH